jgi:hypothetical protein
LHRTPLTLYETQALPVPKIRLAEFSAGLVARRQHINFPLDAVLLTIGGGFGLCGRAGELPPGGKLCIVGEVKK